MKKLKEKKKKKKRKGEEEKKKEKKKKTVISICFGMTNSIPQQKFPDVKSPLKNG